MGGSTALLRRPPAPVTARGLLLPLPLPPERRRGEFGVNGLAAAPALLLLLAVLTGDLGVVGKLFRLSMFAAAGGSGGSSI